MDTVSTPEALRDTHHDTPCVVTFTQPGCQPCKQNLRLLHTCFDDTDIDIHVINVREEAWAHEFITETLGAAATPVNAIVGVDLLTTPLATDPDTMTWWPGFRPDTVRAAARAVTAG